MITKQENFIRKLIREELSNLEKQKEIAHKLGISTMMSVDASQYKNQTNPLDNVFNDAMQFFKSETIISEIFGIGSYFFPRKKSPNDVDFVIKLNIPFEDISVYAFSDKLEKLKEKHPDKEG
ncbi:MAG TPA: hypothetical protein PLC61_08725, partial [Chitinophagales bacterium]|nr:hypothetical protein [Chitinophagales bacterium]